MAVQRGGHRVAGWCRRGVAGAFALCAASGGAQGRWVLREEVRIGSRDEGPASFARVHDVGVTPSGSIVVLDAVLQELRLLDASGRFLRTVARKGAGPGETTRANGLLVMPNGVVWVNDPATGRFTLFNADGTFQRQQRVAITGYAYRWDAWIDADGLIRDRIWGARPGGRRATGASPHCA